MRKKGGGDARRGRGSGLYIRTRIHVATNMYT